MSVALFAIEQNPIVEGELLCNPWKFQNIHGKLLTLITSLIFLKVALMVTHPFFIMVCDLTKMAHFVSCHKYITAEESDNLFIDYCYCFHGFPRVIVSDRNPKFVGKFWQTFT